jgi:hypothetical protein
MTRSLTELEQAFRRYIDAVRCPLNIATELAPDGGNLELRLIGINPAIECCLAASGSASGSMGRTPPRTIAGTSCFSPMCWCRTATTVSSVRSAWTRDTRWFSPILRRCGPTTCSNRLSAGSRKAAARRSYRALQRDRPRDLGASIAARARCRQRSSDLASATRVNMRQNHE